MDGLVERFNKTLKAMPRPSTKAEDQLLSYLLFAVREVPQSTS